jgi:hypothetical protein
MQVQRLDREIMVLIVDIGVLRGVLPSSVGRSVEEYFLSGCSMKWGPLGTSTAAATPIVEAAL